jgi:hypothetical protein
VGNDLILQCLVDRAPLSVLKDLRSAVGYSPETGYFIPLGKDHDAYLFRRLIECIAFHTGQDKVIVRPEEWPKDDRQDNR